MSHQVLLKELSGKEQTWQLAASARDGKTLNASCKNGVVRYVAASHLGEEVHELYSGHSLENAAEAYNRGVPFEAPPRPSRITVRDLIARSEAIPERKAALDRARIRRALMALQHEAVRRMTDEQAIAELCKTPQGLAQYELISRRAPGDPYTSIRIDRSSSVEELVVSLFNTPEGREEYEDAALEIRAILGKDGTGEALVVTLAKAALDLLRRARNSLEGGLDSEAPMEAEWSQEDRALIERIDTVLGNYLAKELLKGM